MFHKDCLENLVIFPSDASQDIGNGNIMRRPALTFGLEKLSYQCILITTKNHFHLGQAIVAQGIQFIGAFIQNLKRLDNFRLLPPTFSKQITRTLSLNSGYKEKESGVFVK